MIIIPARLNSTRFPKKILADVFGRPLFIQSAINASSVDDVILALDSDYTMEIAKKYKFKSVLTDPNIENGTLRVLEACNKLGLNDSENIINLQSDEPFLESSVISSIKECIKNSEFMATCAKIIKDKKDLINPNIVKVVLNHTNDAIYFSRSLIPYNRDNLKLEDINTQYLAHLGVYAYSVKSLKEFSKLPKTNLEDIEKLEQLRVIYYGRQIKVAVVESDSIGVDTKEDLERLLSLKNNL